MRCAPTMTWRCTPSSRCITASITPSRWGTSPRPRWAASLHAKLDAAQAALDRGQTNVAVNMLNAFIKEVNAQSGVLIVDPHGEHLAMHAQMVIDHLLH